MEDRDLDTVLRALADTTRREVLQALHTVQSYELTLADDEKAVALLHKHLPLLSQSGLIEYDRTSETVTIHRGPKWDSAEDLLRQADSSTLSTAKG